MTIKEVVFFCGMLQKERQYHIEGIKAYNKVLTAPSDNIAIEVQGPLRRFWQQQLDYHTKCWIQTGRALDQFTEIADMGVLGSEEPQA